MIKYLAKAVTKEALYEIPQRVGVVENRRRKCGGLWLSEPGR